MGTSLFGELPNGSGASFGLTGIIVAMIGAPFVIWRTLVAQKQAEVAEHGMITERIMNAVEGLGYEKTIKDKLGERTVPNLEVRIGAIYSLERIAQDSIRDHVRIMEILCVYIRENAPASLSEKCPEKPYARQIIGETPVRKWAQELKKPRVDVQVALDIIGRRTDQQISQERDVRTKTNTIGYRLDIRRTCLQACDLSGGNFDNALFTESHLDGALLKNTGLNKTDFYRAKLRGVTAVDVAMQSSQFMQAGFGAAYLRNVNFQNAELYLTEF
ncbi:MAG: pentapeptide repeat-containing protein [Ascidiaceihabitans sp.]|nr:pentapeptide repeat-containing protein [Ascidiaceihabitans sp.]